MLQWLSAPLSISSLDWASSYVTKLHHDLFCLCMTLEHVLECMCAHVHAGDVRRGWRRPDDDYGCRTAGKRMREGGPAAEVRGGAGGHGSGLNTCIFNGLGNFPRLGLGFPFSYVGNSWE